MFFSFDGIDGVGKSTQIKLFHAWLSEKLKRNSTTSPPTSAGQTPIPSIEIFRDPGTTELGEKVRSTLLDHHDLKIDSVSEVFLYMAARAQMVAECIRPAIDQGNGVISDRYVLASLAYQGHGGGVNPEDIRQLAMVATQGIFPDLTFLLDAPVEVALKRLGKLDRMEQKGMEFMSNVRDGFLKEAELDPSIVVIDATKSIEELQQQIRAAAESVILKFEQSRT